MKDLIGREAVIKIINDELEFSDNVYATSVCITIRRAVNDLPSAEPDQKIGKWIKKISKKEKGEEYIAYTPWWYCSECGKGYEPALANTIINYCYNCGADMRGGQSEKIY